MNDNRSGGALLVAGSVTGIITMALHPVAGHTLLAPPELARLVTLDRFVHGLAIFGLPMMFLGALALNQRLAGARRLPLAALVTFGFAAVAIMSAACMSGFVASDILSRMVEGDPKLESRRMLLDYTFRINQGFASIYTIGTCVAIVLWSVAMWQSRRMSRVLAIYGLVIGVVISGALCMGWLTLDVHGMGLVALLQAIWFISAGIALMRTGEVAAQSVSS